MRIRTTLVGLLIELWLPVVLVALWWYASADSSSFYFPPLADIVESFQENWLFAHVGSDVVPSLRNLFTGLLISAALGVSAGVALGLAPTVERIVRPTISFLRALPGIALLPLAIVAIGIGARMSIPLIAFVTVWPILLNTIDGVKGIEPLLHDVRRTFGLGPVMSLLHVVLPGGLPQIVVGLRQALSTGLAVLIFSELVGATQGIGYFTLRAQRSFEVSDMWSGTLLLGVLGYLFNLTFRLIENSLLKWHRIREDGARRS
jgi:ABC-type nitrate/sulfonate/bicarbonate transport system permease component